MRRRLAFTSLLLLVAGVEMSTQGFSLVLARLRVGVTSVVSGAEFHVSALRFAGGALVMSVGLAIWALLIWSEYRRREVVLEGAACPQCGNRTRRVKRREWHRLLSALLGEKLSRRRCEACGWTGLSLKH